MTTSTPACNPPEALGGGPADHGVAVAQADQQALEDALDGLRYLVVSLGLLGGPRSRASGRGGFSILCGLLRCLCVALLDAREVSGSQRNWPSASEACKSNDTGS